MKRRLLDLVCCPVCRDGLDVTVVKQVTEDAGLPASQGDDIVEGALRCRGCRRTYPIVNSVPRLYRDAADAAIFDQRSNESFTLQWQEYQYEDKTWFKDDEDLRKQEFLASVELSGEQLQGSLILDAGCGNGRLTAALARYGAEIVGLDLSGSVDRANGNRRAVAGARAPYVHFVQANVMEPPFRDGVFDHIHTSGVLHHTPDTERAFHSFLRLGSPGGRVYVQLYRRRERWVWIPNAILRSITPRLPVRLLYRLCLLAVPLHTALVLVVAFFRGEQSPLRRASLRERAVSLFDHLSPRYQHRFTPDQARQMFADAGLRNIRDVTLPNEARQMVAFLGEK